MFKKFKLIYIIFIIILLGGIIKFFSNSNDTNSSNSSNIIQHVPVINYNDLTMACIGDSITLGKCKGETMANPYPTLVKNSLNLKEVYNLGIGGSTLCTKNYNSMVSRYGNVPSNTDIISVMGGVNDWAQNFELGELNSTDTKTIYGALNYLCKNLTTKYPNSYIFFITPLPVSDEKLEQYAETPYSLEDVCKAFEDVCGKYNIPVLDIYSTSGFELVANDSVATDGVHPNQEFHEKNISPLIVNFIKENYKAK